MQAHTASWAAHVPPWREALPTSEVGAVVVGGGNKAPFRKQVQRGSCRGFLKHWMLAVTYKQTDGTTLTNKPKQTQTQKNKQTQPKN